MYVSKDDARIHNLIIRFFNANGKLTVNDKFSRSDLGEALHFRQEDFSIAVRGKLLSEEGEEYVPTKQLVRKVAELAAKRVRTPNTEGIKAEFINHFESLESSGSYRPTKELIELAVQIHWSIIPEYEEYMIVNSDIFPNVDPWNYYNHFHTLEDLYKELTNQGKDVTSKKGDMNLGKSIDIDIYSRRWGHKDRYSVMRTIEGWSVTMHQERVGNREGEALIKTLEHDFINYPKNLDMFMLHLWNRADRDEMDVEEMGAHLQSIAEWINLCEQSTPQGIEE